jgi:hypothetical protein
MGPIECPETSVRNYHYTPRNNPEERGSHLNAAEALSHALLTVLHRRRQSFRAVLNLRRWQCSNGKFQNDVHISHCSRRGSLILFVAWFETRSRMQLVYETLPSFECLNCIYAVKCWHCNGSSALLHNSPVRIVSAKTWNSSSCWWISLTRFFQPEYDLPSRRPHFNPY